MANNFLEKITGFMTTEDGDELELNNEPTEEAVEYDTTKTKVAKASTNVSIVLFEPREFDEAEEIANHIKARRACTINLHRMPNEYRQRLIDFLTGVIFAVDGSINRVGADVILCSPKTMQVGGEITLSE